MILEKNQNLTVQECSADICSYSAVSEERIRCGLRIGDMLLALPLRLFDNIFASGSLITVMITYSDRLSWEPYIKMSTYKKACLRKKKTNKQTNKQPTNQIFCPILNIERLFKICCNIHHISGWLSCSSRTDLPSRMHFD